MATSAEGFSPIIDLVAGVPFDASRRRDAVDPDATPPYGPLRAPYGGPFVPCLPAAMTPVANGIFDDKLGPDSRQLTPIFMPGVQDHHTGFLGSKEQLVPRPGLEEGFQKTHMKQDVQKKLDCHRQSGQNSEVQEVHPQGHDVKKLESLIWLYLQTGEDCDSVSTTATSDAACRTPPSDGALELDESISKDCPPPPLLCGPATGGVGAAYEFSAGSVGHPHKCQGPCKYARKKRGCKDGLACSRCHLCTWVHKRNSNTNSSTTGQEDTGTLPGLG